MKKLFALLILLFSAPIVLAQGVSIGPGISFQGGGGGNTFNINGGTAGISQFSVDAFIQAESLPVSDGLTVNIAQPLQDAADACGAAGGGQIIFTNRRYLIDSGSTQHPDAIYIPSGCQVYCPVPLMLSRGTGAQTNFSTVPFAIILNPAFNIIMESSTGWQGCSLLQKNVANFDQTATHTTRDYLNLRAAFAGQGLTLGKDNTLFGADITIKDAFIGGFAWGIVPGGEPVYNPSNTYAQNTTPSATASHVARLHIDHVWVDAIGGIWIDQAHDVTSIARMNVGPSMTTSNTSIFGPFGQITAVGDSPNHPGWYQVTTAADTVIQTGDEVWVNNNPPLVGVATIQKKWIASVIDSRHIDLVDSNSNALTTGVSVVGDLKVGQSALVVTNPTTLPPIGVGDAITGTGIDTDTTIVSYAPDGNAIILSKPALSNQTAQTYTFVDTPWVSGGKLYLDATYRALPGFYFTNSEDSICWACTTYGHTVAYDIGFAMYGFQCSLCEYDSWAAATDDPEAIGFWQHSPNGTQNQATSIQGGWFISVGQPIKGNAPNGGQPSVFQGALMQKNHSGVVFLEWNNGASEFIGINHGTQTPRYAYFGVTAADVTVFANNNINAHLVFKDFEAAGTLRSWGNVIATNSFAGRYEYNGRFLVGGQTAVSPNGNGRCQFSAASCDIALLGTMVDSTFVTVAMSEGGDVTVPEQTNTVYMSDGSAGAGTPINAITIRLPSGTAKDGLQAGQSLRLYFDNSVNTITWGGRINAGMPTSVAPNSWLQCTIEPTTGGSGGGHWLCSREMPACPLRTFVAGGGAHVIITSNDCTVVVNKTNSSVTQVDLQAAPWKGQKLLIKDGKGDASGFNITITPATGNIDASATKVISTDYGQCELVYNGTQWNYISGSCT